MSKNFPALVVNSKGLTVLNSSGKSPSHCLLGLTYSLIYRSKGVDGGLGSSLTDLDLERNHDSG